MVINFILVLMLLIPMNISVYFASADVSKTPIQTETVTVVKEEPVVEDIKSVETVEAEPAPETSTPTSIDPGVYYIAKTVWGEARGCSTLQQAAVIWCILNRVDHEGMPNDIISVVTQPSQFHGYNPNHPVTDEIYALTVDVIDRWTREKNGETNVGRVLPKDYIYFHGDGVRNYFKNAYTGGDIWDWRFGNPYAAS